MYFIFRVTSKGETELNTCILQLIIFNLKTQK